MFEGYSDLIIAFLRYGGALGMMLSVVLGLVFFAYHRAQIVGCYLRSTRKRAWRDAVSTTIKLSMLGWVSFGLFLVSF